MGSETLRVYFPIRPEVEMVDDKQWRVVNGFNVVIEEAGQEPVSISVPAGFVSNFASVPRAPLTYMLFGGIGNTEALLHDYLYSTAEHPREWCDAVYHQALLANTSIPAWKADKMYAAVRAFGGSHYNQGDSHA